jgi:hypothetical protein
MIRGMSDLLFRRPAPRLITLLVSVLIVTAAARVYIPPTQAQSDKVTWSPPVKLSDDTANVPHPAVAADPWGGVHVFWSQDAYGDQETANLIFYRHWDGKSWSEPLDVMAGPDWIQYDFLYATCDATGTIHLIWAGSDGLHYSSVPALNAGNVRSWQPPQVLVEANAMGQSRLVVDQKGTLHVVYSMRRAGTNVMYLHSQDRGLTWSEPVEVTELPAGSPQIPDAVRLEIDSHDGLHLVWTENHPPGYVGRYVFYTRSTDGGMAWTQPMDLSDPSSTDDWDAVINIAVDTWDQLHVIWACGAGSPSRCYRYSKDGGDSWSGIQHLFGELVGLGGWDAMGADPYGNLYWIGILRYPTALYYSRYANTQWIDPPITIISEQESQGLATAHYPQIAIGQGNQLHVLMIEGDQGAVWYLNGQTSWPGVPATLTPTPTPTLQSTPTRGPTLTREPTPDRPTAIPLRPFLQQPPSVPGPGNISSLEAIVWPIAPVALLLVVAITIKVVRLRH